MITEHVLNTSMIRDIFDMEKMNREKNFLLDWITFVNNSSSVYEKISFGTPYRTDAPQVLLAEEGDAKVKFFHKPFLVKKGDLILKPAGTLFSIQSVSKDWKMRMVEFRMPQAMRKKYLFFHLDIIELSNRNFQRIKSHFDMITDYLNEREKLACSIEHQVLAMLNFINIVYADKLRSRKRKKRVEILFEDFMEELLKEKDTFSRNASYYADKLKIAPGYLGNAVREASGKSVQHWINSMTLHTAQELLAGNSDSIKNLATKLGFEEASSFSRFFKKHTGQTPMEYRNGKGIPLGEAEEKINS